jgi:ribose-phosphate pyrophosphokinase
MSDDELVLFALEGSREFGAAVARGLNVALAEHEERDFEDGEHKIRALTPARNRDVFVLHSLHGEPGRSVNDKLCRVLFFIAALRDAGAGRVTAVTPYLCYGRKDRKTKPRDPVTTRYLAQLFEAAGVDCVMAMDVHNLAAFQNAFRRPTIHLEARPLLVEHFAARLGGEDLVVVSPDAGGLKRADRFRDALGKKLGRRLPTAIMEKKRSDDILGGEMLVGDVAGKTAIVLDDLISSGATLLRAARACLDHGAARVFAAATHGVFAEGAEPTLADPALERIALCDTIPPSRLGEALRQTKIDLLDAAGLFADAIGRAHGGGSISELLEA